MFEQRTIMFLVFVGFSLACFVVGYTARRRGWVAEHHSRSVHLHTIVWLWSPVTLFSFWGLEAGSGRDVLTLMAIEPILNAGGKHTRTLSDRWTVVTLDRALSAQFEHTVLVTETGHEILTDRS